MKFTKILLAVVLVGFMWLSAFGFDPPKGLKWNMAFVEVDSVLQLKLKPLGEFRGYHIFSCGNMLFGFLNTNKLAVVRADTFFYENSLENANKFIDSLENVYGDTVLVFGEIGIEEDLYFKFDIVKRYFFVDADTSQLLVVRSDKSSNTLSWIRVQYESPLFVQLKEKDRKKEINFGR